MNPFRELMQFPFHGLGQQDIVESGRGIRFIQTDARYYIGVEARALAFISRQAQTASGDARVDDKYKAAARLYREALGEDCYAWAIEAAEFAEDNVEE